MDQPVSTQIQQGVLVVTINNPPVNALGVAVRQGLDQAITQFADGDCVAMLIVGNGKHFIAGADIREFGKPPQQPFLPDLCNRLEACTKPVVAALHGSVLGGGLEVAMSAHYRIAAPSAKLGLPEVTLGLMPGAGGTQRAPRLMGAEAALALMLSGRPINSAKAQQSGLVDRLADEATLNAEALAYVQDLVANHQGARPSRDAKGLKNASVNRKAIKQAKEQQQRKSPLLYSPKRIIEAVEAAAEQPFDQGLALERKLFSACMDSPQRQGLIHSFFAQREVAKVPESSAAEPKIINQVGVVGGGTMGAGIAIACLQAGLEVIMAERDEPSCARGYKNVERLIHAQLTKGRISQAQYDDLLKRFFVSTDYQSLHQADIVIEAAFEDMTVKHEIFAELDRACHADTIFASNTSYLNIDEIAEHTTRADKVIGLHFFSPAHIMKLMEIIVADKASAQSVATGFALAKRLGKVAVRSAVCDGFIGNRMLASYRQVAYQLVEDGATPYEVDEAVRDFGYPIGPFQMFDLAGGDIGWAMRKRLAPTRDPRDRYVELPDRLCERGWFGQKTGRGWYLYPDGPRSRVEDPDVLALIDEERKRVGITPRTISKDEIQQRYFAAMINAGAEVVADGTALRPLDVDVVLVHGYGFPRHRGGPMCYADSIGLPTVLERIKQYATEDARFWQPSALLEQLVAEGRNFASLNKT